MLKAITLFAAAALAQAKVDWDDLEARELMKMKGHMSAVFTPVNDKGELDFTNLPKMAARLNEWGCNNVMVGGTTGESLSFTHEERKQAVAAWLKIAPEHNINVFAHVGMDSVQDAHVYASEVAAMGVKGIFAMPPVYFKPKNIDDIVDTMAVVASGAPDLPFWYYHFPANTGVEVNVFQMTQAIDASGKIPNYMGVKFTNEILMDYASAGYFKNKKYNMLFGRDEQNIAATATGVSDGDVSSTVNFQSFNLQASNAWNEGRLQDAFDLQQRTTDIIEKWITIVGSYNPQKAMLKMTGIDFGPLRLPQENMPHEMELDLGTAMHALGMNITAEYVRNSTSTDDIHFLQ